MNVSVRATGPWQHTLEVEVPVEQVEERLEQVAREVQRRAVLPGFRRGHVPLTVVRQQFADAVEQKLLEDLIPESASEAVQEAKLDPVVPPLVRNLKFTPGQPLRFEAVVEVRPTVEVKDYRGLTLLRRVRPVDEPAIDRVIARLREESAIFEDLDRPAERGDVVLADSVRLDANGRRLAHTRSRNLRLELGAPDMLPDLEIGLLASQAGQTRQVSIAYPAEHQTPELAGKTVRYEVRVRKIQHKKLRELDDNFAREVFQLGSYEELRARVRANLEGDEQVRVRRELESAVTDELIRRNPVELPERLTEWMLDRVLREAAGNREVPDSLRPELEQRYRPGVERSLKREILLAAVARQEQLKVGDEEVAAEIDRMAQADPRQAARVRARYQSAERREGLAESLLERKAMDWLIEAAQVTEEIVRDDSLLVPATR
jgi:trigger factor